MELTCKGILSISPKNRIFKSSPSPDKQIVEILLQMIEFFAEKGVAQLSSTIQSAYCWELAGRHGKQLLFTSFCICEFVNLWTCICVFPGCTAAKHICPRHVVATPGTFFALVCRVFCLFWAFVTFASWARAPSCAGWQQWDRSKAFRGNFHRSQQNHLWKCVECWKLFGNDTICRRCPIHKYIFVIPRFKGWSSIADAMKVMLRLLNIDWRILLRRRSGRKV